MLLSEADKKPRITVGGQSKADGIGGHRPAQAERSDERKAGQRPIRQRGPDP